MPFVKIDCGILDSSLWPDRNARDIFITALLMADPIELKEPLPQLRVRSLEKTGWTVPPGWYGIAAAAGVGIAARCGIPTEDGLAALEVLGSPDPESRSQDFEGRRVVRIDGGYIILNFDRYRRKDYKSAERSRRYRENKKRHAARVTPNDVTTRSVTQAEAEAEAEAEEYTGTPPTPSGESPDPAQKAKTPFQKPTAQEVTEYALSIGFVLDGEEFVSHYESNGWKVGRVPMKDWKAAIVTWKKRRSEFRKTGSKPAATKEDHERSKW